ncbi:amino acid permease-domain-containing protein [Irpex rosettiformis]|uniref:Amino acid permease-domain-containing protein n=1 Tax=Irpex rosettiformis TaxID=378272 RepID=A0ACB8TNJ2_9APHY|nr:amino acid permease-domain-containing protein [Irpex rosettiformis]
MACDKQSQLAEEARNNVPLEEWVAVEPPSGVQPDLTLQPIGGSILTRPPPSFESAQFDVILRRQRQRPQGGGVLKSTTIPSRFFHLPNTFEFSGWGTMSRIELHEPELSDGLKDIQDTRRITLGQFSASAIAGNSILGGVFYTLPAVVGVAGVLSPISLLVSTMIIWFWRPIMEELASALPISGAPYTYLLNVGSKNLALMGAALLLLDYSATAVVSAATAISYLAGEVKLPFPVIAGTLLILVIFAVVSLSGLKESARIALVVLTMHLMTMIALFVASAVAWGRQGNSQISHNWHEGMQTLSVNDIARQIFNGICIGILGLTGFECIPSYASNIKHGCYPKVLRNLHYPAIVVDVVAMLLVLALVPLNTVLSGGNVLSILAETAAGRWLRIITVVDAVIVLCGGVLNGILSACELFERLARDRLLPQLFRRRIPITRAPAYSIFAFFVFSFALYAIPGANLSIVSKMFSLIWLSVMALFPLAVLLLKFNRGRLSRDCRAPLGKVLFTLAIVAVMIGGNVAIDPSIVGYAAAYFIVIAVFFYVTMKASRLVHTVLWLYDQSKFVRTAVWARSWGARLTTAMSHLRRQPVCILVKSDEINILFHKLLYVSQNEETSCLKLVHFYDEEYGIPSELEANWKILDEAFPEITVDLVRLVLPP